MRVDVRDYLYDNVVCALNAFFSQTSVDYRRKIWTKELINTFVGKFLEKFPKTPSNNFYVVQVQLTAVLAPPTKSRCVDMCDR